MENGHARCVTGAFETTEGLRRWRVSPTDDREYATAVAVGADAVYAGFEGAEAGVDALARGDGTERWHHRFPNRVIEGDIVRSGVPAQPVVADGGVDGPGVDGLYAFGPA